MFYGRSWETAAVLGGGDLPLIHSIRELRKTYKWGGGLMIKHRVKVNICGAIYRLI